MHNISIDKFERISLYEWKPGVSESKECLMKSVEDVVIVRKVFTRNTCGLDLLSKLCPSPEPRRTQWLSLNLWYQFIQATVPSSGQEQHDCPSI